MTTYHFSSNDMLDYGLDKVQPWGLTAEQFEAIQERCSGNAIPSTWAGAQQWAKERSEKLHAEATAVDAETDWGYCLPMGHCDYHVSSDAIAYKTTRGTQFWIFREGAEDGGETFHATLPLDRLEGNHHKSILLAIGGVSNADRDRWENTHSLPEGTPRETFEELWNEMAEAYDRVLVPHGWEAHKPYAEMEIIWAARAEENRKRWADSRARLTEAYEETGCEEYEDYEDEE